MKWIVTFVVCFVLNESVGAPQGVTYLGDGGEMYDDFLSEVTSEDVKRVRRGDGTTVMDILTGSLPWSSDDVMEGAVDVVRETRSADEPMLISPGPAPCNQARDSSPFDGPYQQQYFEPMDGPQSDPKTHKLPVGIIGGGGLGGGHGGLSHGGLVGHQESLLQPVHKETIYYATIPFISGYKMTPIISNKKVIVKDIPGHGHGHDGLIGDGLGVLGGLGGLGGSGLAHDGLPGLPGLSGLPGLPGLPLGGLPSGLSLGGLPSGLSLGGLGHSSRSSRPDTTPPAYTTYPSPPNPDDSFFQSRSSHPQDFYIADPGARHPLDLNIFFETPEATAARDAAPELLTPENYADAIRNLQQQMDHLHSLKLAHESRNQPDEVNCV